MDDAPQLLLTCPTLPPPSLACTAEASPPCRASPQARTLPSAPSAAQAPQVVASATAKASATGAAPKDTTRPPRRPQKPLAVGQSSSTDLAPWASEA